MCIDDNECDAVWAEVGGGDMDSEIASTWILLGGRGGGPIEPTATPDDLDATWLVTAVSPIHCQSLTSPAGQRALPAEPLGKAGPFRSLGLRILIFHHRLLWPDRLSSTPLSHQIRTSIARAQTSASEPTHHLEPATTSPLLTMTMERRGRRRGRRDGR